MKRIYKSKKGSELVEKIIMVAFSVAMGGAVIVYGANVINNSKNANVDFAVATNSSGVQLIAGHKYTFNSIEETISSRNLNNEDMEYFSVSHIWRNDGEEITWGHQNAPSEGFLGYASWDYNDGEFFLNKGSGPQLSFILSETGYMNAYGVDDPETEDAYPRLTADYFDTSFDQRNFNHYFIFTGTYVRRGSGPCLLDYLVEYED